MTVCCRCVSRRWPLLVQQLLHSSCFFHHGCRSLMTITFPSTTCHSLLSPSIAIRPSALTCTASGNNHFVRIVHARPTHLTASLANIISSQAKLKSQETRRRNQYSMHHREDYDPEARQPLLGPSSRLREKTPVGMMNDSESIAVDKFPMRMGSNPHAVQA